MIISVVQGCNGGRRRSLAQCRGAVHAGRLPSKPGSPGPDPLSHSANHRQRRGWAGVSPLSHDRPRQLLPSEAAASLSLAANSPSPSWTRQKVTKGRFFPSLLLLSLSGHVPAMTANRKGHCPAGFWDLKRTSWEKTGGRDLGSPPITECGAQSGLARVHHVRRHIGQWCGRKRSRRARYRMGLNRGSMGLIREIPPGSVIA